jgi:hypothetical protein
MLCTVFVSAFGIQMCAYLWPTPAVGQEQELIYNHRGFNYGANKIWDAINKGVCSFDYSSGCIKN